MITLYLVDNDPYLTYMYNITTLDNSTATLSAKSDHAIEVVL